MDILSVVLQAAFYLLFGITLANFVRRPGPLTLDVFLFFGALAGLFAFSFLRVLFPAIEAILSLLGVALLLAQPGLALRLTRHVTALPRWVGPLMLAGYVGILAALLAFGARQPWLVWLLAAYFVIGDGLAALILAREALRRSGFARWRLALASAAMLLIVTTILVAFIGQSTLAQALALIAAGAFVPVFAPPRWLRRFAQQAVAYQFVSDLSRVEAGAGTARLWQHLASAAVSLTGAVGAEVSPSGDDAAEPLATAGMSDGRAPHVTQVTLERSGQAAELRLRSARPTLFAEDDLALLALLGAQTLAATEREALLSERTAIGERIAATNVELARASAAKSDFLAAMSHELRTPLNAIMGFSELLLSPPAPLSDGAVTEYAGHIHGAGQHLLELINDILDLSRVEAGRLDLRRETTDVARLMTETLNTVRPLAEVKGLALQAELPPELHADVDPARLRQIAYNLLSNAIKFTPAGGSVTVELASEDGVLALHVTDTGTGIPPEDQARIFAAFEQLKPGTAEGTGLGLALTQRLVQAHDGQIEVVSTPGAGSRFSVRLPHPKTLLPGAIPVTADAGDGPLVLIIEDDAAAAELVSLHLRQAGYRAAVVGDGESGLLAAEQLAPAAILLDILLPGLDGWEVLRQLRAGSTTSQIPVMVITIVDNAALGLALGAADYLVKPVSRETLLGALARLAPTPKVGERAVNVLAIDDDPVALRLYRESLTPEGFRVIESATGEDGMARARQGRIDAIVLDLLLPDLDGFEIAARLKADPATRDIPILVMTAHTLTAADKDRLKEHALAVLTKGDEALAGLRSWLRRCLAVQPFG